ncbi:hypothetical protein D3C73_1094590 [compost metagenome]
MASYMAMSDARSKPSRLAPQSGNVAMPMLAPRTISRPSICWQTDTRSMSFSAILAACSGNSRSSNAVNSSPPMRARISNGRRQAFNCSDTQRNTRSPASWPRESLTRLKPSRSRYNRTQALSARSPRNSRFSTVW